MPGDAIYGTNAFCVQKYAPANVSSAMGEYKSARLDYDLQFYGGAGYHLFTNPEWAT